MNTETNSLKGFFYSLAGTAAFAAGLVAGKHALDGFDPFTLCVVATAGAAVWTLLIALVTGTCRSLVVRGYAAWRQVCLLGVISGVAMITLHSGMNRLDPSFVAFLFKLQPVFVILMGMVLLHERVLPRELAAAAVMLTGACFSVIGRWHVVGTGTVLILITSVLGAFQLFIGKLEAGIIPATALVFYRALIALVVVTPWVLATTGVDFNVAPAYWFSAALAALCGTSLGLVLMFESYRYWHLSRSSMVHTAMPLFVLPAAWLFLDRVPAARELLGGAIILAGGFTLGWIQLGRRKQTTESC